MKLILTGVILLGFVLGSPKSEMVKSGVYSYSNANVEKTNSGEIRRLIDGETTHLENFEINTTMLEPGKATFKSQVNSELEQIIFVKEGQLEISINMNSKVLGPGSVALIMPGDEHQITNSGKSQATYYIIRYKSKMPVDNNRGKTAGGSILIDWEKIQFQPHERGGIRKFFDRKSAMSERIEMHATTLNEGIKSHEPHTHAPAEIVIMMDGNTEMEIGDKVYPGEIGDVYFLGSNIPHAIRNTGTKQCMYLAFQWE